MCSLTDSYPCEYHDLNYTVPCALAVRRCLSSVSLPQVVSLIINGKGHGDWRLTALGISVFSSHGAHRMVIIPQLIRRNCYDFDLFLSNGLGFRLSVYEASYWHVKETAASCSILRTGVSYSVTRTTTYPVVINC